MRKKNKLFCHPNNEELIVKDIGIIFDMDGVIIDTCDLHEKSWFYISKNYNFTWNNELNFKRNIFGTSSIDSATLLFGSHILKHDLIKICNEKCEIYQELLRKNINNIVTKGFLSFFNCLVDLKIPIVLGTSSIAYEAEFVLKSLGIFNHFKAVIDISKVNKPKPHPEVYIKASMALGLSQWQCIGFEDSLSGITALEKAGIKCIVIGSTLTHEKLISSGLNYDLYIKDFSQITIDEVIDINRNLIIMGE